jgi:Holliday junction resolvase
LFFNQIMIICCVFWARSYKKLLIWQTKGFIIKENLIKDMGGKAKGTNAERELIHMFWKKGWAAIRVAGSGSSHYPSPDVIAGNALRRLAIECKAVGGTSKYISFEQVGDLNKFAEIFGAEALIGLRFDRLEWLFIATSELEKTENAYRINMEHAKRNGILFDELIRL